jgi:hypothetical protein
MKLPITRTSLAILLLSTSWLAAPEAPASTHVSRCSTSEGVSTYTDGSCRAIGGKPVPMSPNLMRSLAREGLLGGDEGFRPQPGLGRAGTLAVAAQKNRLGTGSCPRTPAELASALRDSVGDGEVNRLASLYDWGGMSNRQANAVLARLARISEKPLIDGQYFATGDGGTVQLVQGAHSAATVTEVSVNRRAGCLLLAL